MFSMFKKNTFRVSGSKKTGYAVLEHDAIIYDLLTKNSANVICDICNAGIGPGWDKVEAEIVRRGQFPVIECAEPFTAIWHSDEINK